MNIGKTSIPRAAFAALTSCIIASSAQATMLATNDFEASFADFTISPAAEDVASLATYESESSKPTALPATSDTFPYPGFGAKYLAVDSGDSTLWRTIAARSADTYFDAYVQFEAAGGEITYDGNAKFVVYLDAESSKLCVISGTSESDRTPVTNTLSQTVASGTWGRLTVKAIHGSVFTFQVMLNGSVLSTEAGAVSTFYSMTADTSISTVGFKGTGALDNFVARTTNPHAPAAATVNGERYGTLEQAVAEANGAVIELQADHTGTVAGLAMNSSCRIRLNNHAFGGFTGADGVAVSATLGEDGVTTYAGEGAASLNGTWYATFASAYDMSASQNDVLVVNVSGDFTPAFTNPNGNNNKTFASITFKTTSESELHIATTDGTSTMKSKSWSFPDTATLQLTVPANFAMSRFSGGTLEVPNGITAVIDSSAALENVSVLSGCGTIKVNSNYPMYFINNASTPRLFAGESWNGVVELANSYDGDLDLKRLASAHSTVRFNGFTTTRIANGTYGVNVELAGGGLTLNGDYTRTWTIAGSLSGSGAFNVLDAGGTGGIGSNFYFSGDVRKFSGSVNVASATTRVVLGAASTSSSAPCIVVAAGVSITNDASATWSAKNLVLLGSLTVNGFVSVTNNCIWGNDGKGVIRFNNASTALTTNSFASSWNGTYVVGWDPEASTYFDLNKYGSANYTVAFDGTWPSGAYFGAGANAAYTATARLRLDKSVTIDDGYSGADKIVTLSHLTGSGDFTTRRYNVQTESLQCYYAITRLDGEYSGELVVRDAARLSIDRIYVASLPVAGERVVKARVSKYYNSTVAAGEFAGDMALYVGGAATSQRLTYASLNNQSGLYLAVAQVGGKYYATLADAVANAGSARSITKLADTGEAIPAGWKLKSDGTAYVKVRGPIIRIF